MQPTRKSGILLHPTSLPGPGGIGSLGREAYRFVDFLARAGQSLWQVLPLGPTAYGDSPYSCYSAFAGNPLLIDLELLVEDGDIPHEEPDIELPADRVDYNRVQLYKNSILKRASANFFAKGSSGRRDEFHSFCDNTPWLHDYALFMALKESRGGKDWLHWPKELVCRLPKALSGFEEKEGELIGLHKYSQWQFFRQWRAVKGYANDNGIEIIGDIPIFVALDSADVWANPQLFHLDERGRPTVVAGVPPDYFSKTGQLWGNPLYNWDMISFHGYGWWIERMRSALELYDMVRLDHFRGFEAFWEIPAQDRTAENGRWVKGPGVELFNALIDALGTLPVIAEDLGVITPDVEALRDRFGFPGMVILQFAFGSEAENPYLPHNHGRDAVVYTGTHDNDTTAGWFASISEEERRDVLDYINSDGREISRDLVREALSSVAATAIVPLQDILGLDSSARMNIPGTSAHNWTWRFSAADLRDDNCTWLRHLTEIYGRVKRKQIYS